MSTLNRSYTSLTHQRSQTGWASFSPFFYDTHNGHNCNTFCLLSTPTKYSRLNVTVDGIGWGRWEEEVVSVFISQTWELCTMCFGNINKLTTIIWTTCFFSSSHMCVDRMAAKLFVCCCSCVLLLVALFSLHCFFYTGFSYIFSW